jgi:integrase
MRKQLTAEMIAKLAPPGTGRLEIFDAIVPALALRVTPNGAKSFVVRGRVKGRPSPIRVTLGDAREIKLSEARQAASDALRAMRGGIDPREARKTKAERERTTEALTFERLMNEWAVLHLSHGRPRYAAEAVRAIRCGLPDLLKRPAARIAKADAVNALDRIALAGKAVTAGRTMAYARACFTWGEKRGKVAANPFINLPIAAGKTERERVLSDGEIREIWAAADTLAYPFGPFFKLAILTLQRREEVAAMRWSEISEDLSRWSLPGARMKNGRPHDVHLSEPARDVLRTLPRLVGCDFVFSSGRRRGAVKEPGPISGFSQGKRYLDAKAAVVEPWRLHDLRRTGVTTLAALGFDSIVVDKLLAHQPGKLRGVAGVYQRHDFARERAAALDAWAAHVTEIDTGAKVVALR